LGQRLGAAAELFYAEKAEDLGIRMLHFDNEDPIKR
jgi:hypothetical protein